MASDPLAALVGKLLPCPFCGGAATERNSIVTCAECCAVASITAWNRRATALDASRVGVPEVAAGWLHDIVHTEDGEPDQALSFTPDAFPLSDTGMFKSVRAQPLYLHPCPVTEVAADRGALVNHAIKLLRRMEPWDGKTYSAELSHTLRLLAAAPAGENDDGF